MQLPSLPLAGTPGSTLTAKGFTWSDEQSRFLAAAGAALAASLDYEQVLVHLADLVVPYLADWCSVALVEPGRPLRRVALTCARPASRPPVEPICRCQLAPGVRYACVYAIATGSTELIESSSPDHFDQFLADPGYCALMKQLEPCSSLSVPLKVRGEIRGVIAYVMAESGRSHTPESRALAEELARRAAIAVDNALLYRHAQRRLAELSTVQRVAQVISRAVHIEQICQAVVEQVSEAFGYRMVSIYLRTDDELLLQAAVGYREVLARIPMTSGVIGRVTRTGEPCFVRDATADPDFLYAIDGIRQGLFVPLRYASDAPLGVIGVESTGEPLLTDDDLGILTLLADQVSVAVMNARLFARVEDAASRWSSLIETSGSVIICLDLQMRVTEFNREAERIFGLEREAALGHDYLTRFVSPADRPALGALAAAAVAGLSPRPVEMVVGPSEGLERAFLWTLTCRRDAAGAPTELLVVGQDITERRQAEEARLAVERKMLEAQRLESLGVLAGGIAHDFNNLLAAILGNASLLLLDLTPGTEAYQSARQIELVTQRAADLVGQMLAYAGRGRFNLQPVNLNLLVAEMILLLRVSVSKGTILLQHLAPDLPPVEADPAQIRQVVMNLIVNASEALSSTGGSVTISTGLRYVGPEELAAAVVGYDLPPGFYVALTVADTGVGMDEATRGRIFDPFFTTKFTGRGLGLAAVLGIVRSHRGALIVTSMPGHGSVFIVLLPGQPGSAVAPLIDLPLGAVARRERPGQPTLLVIDDEEDVRQMLVRVLERGGYIALGAADGESGLSLSRSLGVKLTAVLLDLTLPRMSGEQIFHELRRARPDLPVLLMSGFSAEEMTRRFPDEAPAAVIQKPFSASTLLELVRDVVGPWR